MGKHLYLQDSMKLPFLFALFFTTMFQSIHMMEKAAVSLEKLKRDPTSYYSWLPRDLHNELKQYFKHPAFEWIMYEHARINGYFPRILATPGHYLYSAIVNRKKNLFIADAPNGTIKIWNLDPWYYKESLEGHPSTIFNLLLYTKKNRLISRSENGIIQEWDLTTKQRTKILNDEPYASIAIDKEHKRLVLATRNTGTIKFLDLDTWQFQQELKTHKWPVCALTVDEINKKLISASFDCSIKVWNLTTLQHQETLSNGEYASIRHFAIDKINNHLFAGSSYIVTIWDLNNYQQLHRLILPTGNCIKLDAKTKQVYCIRDTIINSDHKVVIYNLEDQQLKNILDAADADTTLLISSMYEAVKKKTKLDLSDESRKKALELLPPTLQKTLQQKLQ